MFYIQYPLAFLVPVVHDILPGRFYLFFASMISPQWLKSVLRCLGNSKLTALAVKEKLMRQDCKIAAAGSVQVGKNVEIYPTWWLFMNWAVNILVSFLACKDSIKAHQSTNLQFLSR